MGGGGSKSSTVIHETLDRNEVNTINNVRNERNVLDQTDVINRVHIGDRAKKGIVEGANSVNAGYAVYGLMDLDSSMDRYCQQWLDRIRGNPNYQLPFQCQEHFMSKDDWFPVRRSYLI